MITEKIIFAGTPEFACPALKILVDMGAGPEMVLTQPDRRSGRGQKFKISPIKKYAISEDILVRQPEHLDDVGFISELNNIKPDVIIVAAYGLILPKDILSIPRYGCINIHASLLPRWRGASPIQSAILAGDEDTGISLMSVEEGLDSGPIFCSESITIGESETYGELHDRLAILGAKLLKENLGKILSGNLHSKPQDSSKVTHARKIKKIKTRINWDSSNTSINRQIRAYNPYPTAFFQFKDEKIKCWKAKIGCNNGSPAGKVINFGAEGIEVAGGQGSLIITEIQRPGRRRLCATKLAQQYDLTDTLFQ